MDAKQSAPRPGSQKPATVLVIDDEQDLLEELTTALGDAGHRPVATTSPHEALDILAADETIEVAVSDIRMPEMDGLTLIAAVRERFPERTWLQLLLVTGHASVDNAVAALRLEAVDFLDKPIRRETFLASVARALDKASEARRALLTWRTGGQELARFSEEAARLAGLLSSYAPRRPADAAVPELPARDIPPSTERLAQLVRLRGLRAAFFSGKLFAEPVWDILLELMEVRLGGGRPLSVSSLCIASGAPSTTALRRIEDLEREGLVTRVPDPADGRRQFVELTPTAADQLTAYLHALDRELRA